MTIVTLDFESYFDSQVSLKKLNTIEYVAHPDFHVHGAHIKVDDQPSKWYTGFDEVLAALQAIEDEHGDINLLGQNTAFDAYILWYFGNYAPAYYSDTMAMSRGMWPGKSASLKNICMRLWPSNPKMRKGEELVNFKGVTLNELLADPEQFDILQRYCEQDVELTYAIYKAIEPYYPDEELDLIDITTRMFAEPILRLDVPKLVAFRDAQITERERVIAESGLAESTLASNAQFLRALESRGVDIQYKENAAGKLIPALGKSDIGFQTMVRAYPEYDGLWKGRMAAKSVGAIARAERFIQTAELARGYMPVPLRYYAAHTGRYGGAESLNLQNLNRGSDLRKALIAPPDHLVYVADSSNIEARMLAWEAGQEDLLAIFRSGGDVYSHTATAIYNRTVDKKKDPHERFVGKVTTLGLGYGMGWRKAKDTFAAGALGGPPVFFEDHEIQHIVNVYRTSNFHIVNLWREAEQAIIDMYLGNERQWRMLQIKKNMLLMPNGMALRYDNLRSDSEYGGNFEYWNGRAFTKIYGGKLVENITQALSRIVLFTQMLHIDKYARQFGGRAALNVHDEIIVVAPDFGARYLGNDEWENGEKAAEFFEGMRQIMLVAPDWCRDLPLDAEGGYALEYSK